MDISRDINSHFKKYNQYRYGNIIFYTKYDYDRYVKTIKYKQVSDSEQSKK